MSENSSNNLSNINPLYLTILDDGRHQSIALVIAASHDDVQNHMKEVHLPVQKLIIDDKLMKSSIRRGTLRGEKSDVTITTIDLGRHLTIDGDPNFKGAIAIDHKE